MRKCLSLVIAAGLLSCAVTPGFAAGPDNPAVKARRAFFEAMYFNAGPLFGMMKGKVPYDAKRAQTLADNVKLMTMMSTGAMWPKGTDNAALKGQTRAQPAIWAADSQFVTRWQDWRKAAAELAAVAGKGKDGMVAKLKEMGAACGACHKAYRAKDF